MGWTYTHRGSQPVKEFLRDQIDCENDAGKWEMLDCAIVKFRTAYMAVRITRPGQEPYVVAFVFLLDYRPKEDFNIGYKDMDEFMGPYQCDCPERILKLLTPTDSEWANEWRRKCWANIERKKSIKLRVGMVIETKPLQFYGGRELTQFLVARVRPLRFTSPDAPGYYRITRETLNRNFIRRIKP